MLSWCIHSWNKLCSPCTAVDKPWVVHKLFTGLYVDSDKKSAPFSKTCLAVLSVFELVISLNFFGLFKKSKSWNRIGCLFASLLLISIFKDSSNSKGDALLCISVKCHLKSTCYAMLTVVCDSAFQLYLFYEQVLHLKKSVDNLLITPKLPTGLSLPDWIAFGVFCLYQTYIPG